MSNQRGYTITVNSVLVTEECCSCHMLFALPDDMQARLRKTHSSFYCPAGHSQSYFSKSTEEKLRDEKAALERRLASRDDDLRAERMSHDSTRNSLRATKGAHTKTKQRAAKGICPEPSCHRSFVNVARHVKTCHPELEMS